MRRGFVADGMSITLKNGRIHHGASGPFRVRRRGSRDDRRRLALGHAGQATETGDERDRFLVMVDAVDPSPLSRICGQRRPALGSEPATSRARRGARHRGRKSGNSCGVSDTESQTGQINEHSIWASIEFPTRRATPFGPGADGIACHDIHPTPLFAPPWVHDRYLRILPPWPRPVATVQSPPFGNRPAQAVKRSSHSR